MNFDELPNDIQEALAEIRMSAENSLEKVRLFAENKSKSKFKKDLISLGFEVVSVGSRPFIFISKKSSKNSIATLYNPKNESLDGFIKATKSNQKIAEWYCKNLKNIINEAFKMDPVVCVAFLNTSLVNALDI